MTVTKPAETLIHTRYYIYPYEYIYNSLKLHPGEISDKK